jgi:hypothetical protein
MTRSARLGIASIALISGAIAIWIFWPDGPPLGFVLIFIAFIAALLAAWSGSKWWLAIPCTLAALFAFLMDVGFHAR